MTKTLKQLIQEAHNSGIQTDFRELQWQLSEKKYIELVKNWLMQKRQEEKAGKCQCYACQDLRNEKIDELLEELL